MLCKLTKVLLLASVLGGLCAPAQANTTATGTPRSFSPATGAAGRIGPSNAPIRFVQNDITVSPETAGDPTSVPVAPSLPQQPAPVRIALLLPLRSDALGPAADAVRAGFMAANEREKDGSLTITVIETGDAPQDILSVYGAALSGNDIVVGPLSRSGVTAIAQSGTVTKPTIALTQADTQDDAEIALPPAMLVMGLSVEEEARQVADWASAGKALVVSTDTAWQRRAAKAFGTQWQHHGRELESVELGASSGYLSASGLAQLKNRIQEEKPALLFAALDAEQARQIRLVIGNDVAFYGTSQLNPLALADWVAADRVPQMNGVRLVDMPWQLQADHPAVMIYPPLAVNADQKRSADLERLYALGIDAFRVAKEIALKRTHFEIDGVTGRLTVDFGRNMARFGRLEVRAIYRGGAVVPLSGAR
jgi:outer membrane PBP1 activator LpoA protein